MDLYPIEFFTIPIQILGFGPSDKGVQKFLFSSNFFFLSNVLIYYESILTYKKITLI